MEFEKAHQLLLDRHLSIRSGERRGRLSRGHQYAEKLMLRNVWCRYSAIWMTCILNMKSMTGTVNHSFWMLPFSRPAGNSVWNVTVIRAMWRIWTGRNSVTRLTVIHSWAEWAGESFTFPSMMYRTARKSAGCCCKWSLPPPCSVTPVRAVSLTAGTRDPKTILESKEGLTPQRCDASMKHELSDSP